MNAQTLTAALKGKWHGGYGLAFCPAHENHRTPALSLRDGEGGRLLARCHAGCDFRDIMAAIRAMGLIGDGGGAFAPSLADTMKARIAEQAERARKTAKARRAWAEGLPAAGTLAERYLRARAIGAPLPPSLRFAPAAWHPSAKRLPAMLAAVSVEGEAAPVALHRTYLAEPGRKADADPARAMLGPVAGGAVRLSEGAGPLVVAEGIETALSLVDALHGLSPRVWAALSTSGVRGLRLPDTPAELVVAPDGDAPGREAAQALAQRATAAGWRVRILPAPGEGKDWNGAAQAAKGGAA